jgi:hypothetical protein
MTCRHPLCPHVPCSPLTIAAHEGRKAAVVDIGGAFLNAEMTTGIDVHMRLDRTISDMMVELDLQYEAYRDTKGCIIVQLDLALYGCVESAALWYENLRTTMTSLGYDTNSYDNRVFNSVLQLCAWTTCSLPIRAWR